MKIAVDFDGTVVKHRFPEVGEELPLAVETIIGWISDGHQIILNTMRSGRYLVDAVAWFSDRGIDLYGVNRDPEQEEWTKSPKVYAHLYIDDAALGCPTKPDPTRQRRVVVDWVAVSELFNNMANGGSK